MSFPKFPEREAWLKDYVSCLPQSEKRDACLECETPFASLDGRLYCPACARGMWLADQEVWFLTHRMVGGAIAGALEADVPPEVIHSAIAWALREAELAQLPPQTRVAA